MKSALRFEVHSLYYSLNTSMSGKFSWILISKTSGVTGGILVIIDGSSDGILLVIGVLIAGIVGIFECDE